VATSLRPLSVGEILDAGIKVVTRHWKPLAGMIAILTGPLFVVYVLLLASIDKELLGLSATFSTSSTSSTSSADFGTTEIVGFGLTYVLLFVTFLVAFVACFKAVSDAWLGSTPSIRRSLRFALRRFWSAGVLGIVAGVVVVIGLFLCIAPGIWIAIAWSLSLPALLFERIGPFAALQRSFSLIKGRWWASFLVCVVGYLMVSIIGGVIQLGLEGIAEAATHDNTVVLAIAQVIGSTISAAVTYPYLAAVLTILYFDQRVRKEGFDLQLQAESFGVERDPDAPLPAPLIGDEVYTPEQRAAAPYWPPPPGWTPPPAAPEPSQWASSSGWSAPSAGEDSTAPSWGTAGDPLRHDEPLDPLPPRDEEPPPTYPSWSERKAAEESKRDDDDDDDDKPDPGRASWLPPEPPRGPGGL
jgi:hypothetical protein